MSVNQKGRLESAVEPSPGLFLSVAGFRWDRLTPEMPPALRMADLKPGWYSFDQEKLGVALQPAE